MKIEIKDIHYSEPLSDDSPAFSASLYIDGVKVGIAKNDGQGGNTSYDALDPKYRETISKAEAYCAALPKVKSSIMDDDGKPMEFDQSLENFIDELVEQYLRKRNLDNLKRHEKTKILYGDFESGIVKYIKFKRPLAEILTHPNGEQILADNIIKIVLPQLEEGMKILNHNLPETVYQKAGLEKNQYNSVGIPLQKPRPPKKKPGPKPGKGQ